MEKKRTRHGDRVVKHKGSALSVEDQIRKEYNGTRRDSYWYNGDCQDWPGLWMRLATKYGMPIAAIKNIVAHNGITDRPMPAPLTEDQIRERQEKRGDYLMERYRKLESYRWYSLLRKKDHEQE